MPLTAEISDFLETLYPDANAAVRNGTLGIAEASDAALAAIAEYVPTAELAFGYGSVFGSRGRPYSDIDVMIFVREARSLTNYCFMVSGVPVDLHVVGLDAVPDLVVHAQRTGVCSILSAVTHGVLLLDRQGIGEEFRTRMSGAWAEQPSPGPDRELRTLRWMITSQLADLAQARPAAEVRAAALTAYPLLVRLYHSAKGGWRDRGKWTVRRRSGSDDRLDALTGSYAALFARDDKAAFLECALDILALAGGPLCLGQGNRLDLAVESVSDAAG